MSLIDFNYFNRNNIVSRINSINSNSSSSSSGSLLSTNSSFNRTGDPEQDAINYANQKGITVEEAKAELKAIYGEPQQRLNFLA